MRKIITFLFIGLLSIPAMAGHHKGGHHGDVVDVAASNDIFSTLVAAVKAADLVTTLKGDGPFTVFAPTNDAFAALPAGTVDMLLKPENKALLTKVLTYHVVAGKVTAKQAMQLSNAPTVEGSDITIGTAMGKVMINDATVIKADVKAKNGVIHVIDKVLLPASVAAAL